jgi:hypothetical protein
MAKSKSNRPRAKYLALRGQGVSHTEAMRQATNTSHAADWATAGAAATPALAGPSLLGGLPTGEGAPTAPAAAPGVYAFVDDATRQPTGPARRYQALYELPATMREYKPGDFVQIMKVGRFDHPEYGEFEITPATLDEIARNFAERVRGVDLCVDLNHEPDHAAYGWFKEVVARGDDGLWARIEWTDEGLGFLQGGRYRYFSPEWGTYEDAETNRVYANVLYGGALTNRPFLKNMQPLALSEVGLSLADGSPTKRENGEDYPAAAFAFVGDPQRPSTWRLRIWESLAKKVTREQLGRAAAAFSREGGPAGVSWGNHPKVKAKLRAEFGRLGVQAGELPEALRATEPATETRAAADPTAGEQEELDEAEVVRGVIRDLICALGMPDGCPSALYLVARCTLGLMDFFGVTPAEVGTDESAMAPMAALAERESAPTAPTAELTAAAVTPAPNPTPTDPTTNGAPASEPANKQASEGSNHMDPIQSNAAATAGAGATPAAGTEPRVGVTMADVQALNEIRELRARLAFAEARADEAHSANVESARALRMQKLTDRVNAWTTPDRYGKVLVTPGEKQPLLALLQTLSDTQIEAQIAVIEARIPMRLGEVGTSEGGQVATIDSSDDRAELAAQVRRHLKEHPQLGTFRAAAEDLLASSKGRTYNGRVERVRSGFVAEKVTR